VIVVGSIEALRRRFKQTLIMAVVVLCRHQAYWTSEMVDGLTSARKLVCGEEGATQAIQCREV